jgi:ATP-dependent Clp protease ATP-binding subunit ClpA
MDEPMWQGFSPTFRRVIELAHAEALRFGGPVDDDTLLAGLLADADSDAARVLPAHGVSLDQVRDGLTRAEIPTPAPSPSPAVRAPRKSDSVDPALRGPGVNWTVVFDDSGPHVPFTESAKRAVHRASDESLIRRRKVSAEDLLLALLRNGGSAARLLADHADGLRADLEQLNRPTGDK